MFRRFIFALLLTFGAKLAWLDRAALEHGEMVGQRQDRLHHVQIVHARRIHLGQGGRKEIGLLLIVALDRDTVAGLDDRFEQLGRPQGRVFRLRRRAQRLALVARGDRLRAVMGLT